MIETRLTALETRPLGTEPPLNILRLTTPAGFHHEAGQFLNVVLAGTTSLPLSIASAPEQLPELTLLYRSTPGLEEARLMDSYLNEAAPNASLLIDGPHGAVTLGRSDRAPLMLICGGTGASQAIAFASARVQRHPEAWLYCLACADREADLYIGDMLPPACQRTLIADTDRTRNNRALLWLKNNVEVVDRDGGGRIILSGGPAFVYAVTDTLTELGVDRARLESDVYAYAPR